MAFIHRFLLFMVLAMGSWGCSTPRKQMWDYDYGANNQAPGSAYAADGFALKNRHPEHPEIQPVQFYYKDCEPSGDRSYYSRTSYECSDPH